VDGPEPTGRSFVVEHIHIYRIEGDRIAEHWAARDDLGAMRQLGHLG
jgi:predicted ester cyclase